MSEEENKPSKIIIDEDWKTQAQREKEELEKAAEAQEAQPQAQGEPPPASFTSLLSSLAMQAMIGLGHLPNPVTNKAEPHLGEAKYAIDLLEILKEKTQGNRTPEEESLLEDLLHQLRLGFVATQQSGTPATKS